jgi:DNA-binding transcriptional regulator YhcF (GntR family)
VRDGIIYVEKGRHSVVTAAPRVQLERIDSEEIRECLGLLVTAMAQ